MPPRTRALPVALVAMTFGFAPGSLRAAERSCAPPSIEADAGVRQRFPDLLQRVRIDVLGRDDIDTCARITLHLAHDEALDVGVSLPDGRSASRTVSRGEDVVPTLQALLLVPVPAVVVSSRAAPRRIAQARPAPRATSQDPNRDDRENTTEISPRSFGVELSVLGGSRVGDGQASLGFGVASLLDVQGFLFGFTGRSDRYTQLSRDTAEIALELGAVLGKRFWLQGVALDTTIGPALAMKGASDTEVVAANDAMTMRIRNESSTGPVPRLVVGARLGFSPRSVLRTFVAVDGAVGPARALDATDSNEPRLPLWTLGFALGGTVGTP